MKHAFRTLLLLAALSGTALTSFSPRMAVAQEANATSVVSGITLPKGAASFGQSTDLFGGVLVDLAKEATVQMTPAEQDAEVFVWDGDNFKATRVPFNQSAVAAKLTAAGYEVKNINTIINVFNHFDVNDGTLPFQPSLFVRPVYFQAVNQAKGSALLGAWLQSQDALALALLPMEYKAPPKAAPLPEVAGANAVLVKDFSNPTQGMSPRPLLVFPALVRKPGAARGYCKDGSGKPLSGVQVEVEVSAGGGFRTLHHGRTNAQGLYEVLLPAGVARVTAALAPVSLGEQTIEMHLEPLQGETDGFDSAKGHVDNFVLRTSGEYGGNIRVLHSLPEGGTIEISVTPQGKLMDGTTGHTFVFRYLSGSNTETTYLEHLPLGRYIVSARYFEDGEALPMRVARTFGSDEERTPQESLPVVWVNGVDAISGHFSKSHLRAFQVTLVP